MITSPPFDAGAVKVTVADVEPVDAAVEIIGALGEVFELKTKFSPVSG